MSFDYPWVSTMLPAIYMIECLYAGLALAGILCFFASGDYPI
jgi:formate-dependent nitrite reductase membrane component NrfD